MPGDAGKIFGHGDNAAGDMIDRHQIEAGAGRPGQGADAAFGNQPENHVDVFEAADRTVAPIANDHRRPGDRPAQP